jgi:hypothetical protein
MRSRTGFGIGFEKQQRTHSNRLDLEAARRKWLAEEGHETSIDFLAYRDVFVKVADFHSFQCRNKIVFK